MRITLVTDSSCHACMKHAKLVKAQIASSPDHDLTIIDVEKETMLRKASTFIRNHYIKSVPAIVFHTDPFHTVDGIDQSTKELKKYL